MRILLLGPCTGDYLAATLLHGLRALHGDNVVDVPQQEESYASHRADLASRTHGGGFTLFFNLPDAHVERRNIEARLGEFDLVVIADLWRSFGWLVQWRWKLDPRRTVVVDGSDHDALFPHGGFRWRRPWLWGLPGVPRGMRYFKREWTPRSRFGIAGRAFPGAVLRRLPADGRLRTISFGIPEDRIVADAPAKSRLFATHSVDPEVAARVPGAREAKPFQDEAAYVADLRAARFGVTTRRGGWDCLRHYEIAAAGAVPCFRDLEDKPATCAPHGLDATNCVTYRNADDLLRRVEAMPPAEYARLQAGALAWVRAHTTVAVARRFLDACRT